MTVDIAILGTVVALALLFELTNGWNDAANAIATVVSTRVLKPRTAVLLSAAFNVAGALLSTKVAATVSGMVNAQMISPSAVAGAMVAGALWNAIMTRLGMPISASHALLGSVAGASVAVAGVEVLKWSALTKALNGLWSSPLIGLVIAFLLTVPLLKMSTRPRLWLGGAIVVALAYSYKPWLAGVTLLFLAAVVLQLRQRQGRDEDSHWRMYQLVSSSLMSLAHGTNDAQKVMGVITMALISGQSLSEGSAPPLWVILACAITMGIGTYMGGWQVVKTLGEELTDLRPIHGFAAETAGAAVLSTAAHLGVPVSTTHTITGSIMGVGAAKSEVNWRVAGKIVAAWVFTIPVTFIVGFILSRSIAQFGLWIMIGVSLAGMALFGILHWRQARGRRPAGAKEQIAVSKYSESDT